MITRPCLFSDSLSIAVEKIGLARRTSTLLLRASTREPRILVERMAARNWLLEEGSDFKFPKNVKDGTSTRLIQVGNCKDPPEGSEFLQRP
jgi:hypothetical protein